MSEPRKGGPPRPKLITIDGIEWPVTQVAMERLGIRASGTLHKWDAYCPLIMVGLRPVPPAGSELAATHPKYYNPNLIDELKVARNKALTEGVWINPKDVKHVRITIPAGKEWFSFSKVWKLLKAVKPTMTKSAAVQALMVFSKGTFRLEGNAYGKRLIRRDFGFNADLWSLGDQVSQICKSIADELDGLAQKEHDRKKVTITDRRFGTADAAGRKPRAFDTFDGIFNDAAGKRFTIRKAAAITKENGGVVISYPRMNEYTKEKDDKHPALGCPWLPEQILSTEPRQVPGTQRFLETITERDLQRLQAAITLGLRKDPAAKDRVDSRQVCAHYKVDPRLDNLISVAILLSSWGDAGLISKKTLKRRDNSRRRWNAAQTYVLGEIETRLDGRKLLDVARAEASFATNTTRERIMAALGEEWTANRQIRKKLGRRSPSATTIYKVLTGEARAGRVERDPPLDVSRPLPVSNNGFQNLNVRWRIAPPTNGDQRESRTHAPKFTNTPKLDAEQPFPPTATDLVTLDQMAAAVHRRKRSLERYTSNLPPARVTGKSGRPSLWSWAECRPWLENEFGIKLPVSFPGLN